MGSKGEKAKAGKSSGGDAKKAAEAVDEVGASEQAPEATALSAADRAFLQRAGRLLVNISSAKYLRRAKREGYSAKEHAAGWAYWSQASGMTRPLDHWFGEAEQGAEDDGIAADRMQLLRALDGFENKWFPRTRMIIRRVVPKASRDGFTAAFFKDLAQQPLGPGVVGSVKTFLRRVSDLATTKQPGAKEVWAKLRERGLTAKVQASMEALVKEAEGMSFEPSKAKVSPDDLATAQAAQFEALDNLRDWFNDIGTTLRPAFNAREQVVLGLTVLKVSGGSSDPEDLGVDADGEAGEAGDEADAEPGPAAPEAAGKVSNAAKGSKGKPR